MTWSAVNFHVQQDKDHAVPPEDPAPSNYSTIHVSIKLSQADGEKEQKCLKTLKLDPIQTTSCIVDQTAGPPSRPYRPCSAGGRKGSENAGRRQHCDVSFACSKGRQKQGPRYDTVGPRVVPRVNRQGSVRTRYCRPVTCFQFPAVPSGLTSFTQRGQVLKLW